MTLARGSTSCSCSTVFPVAVGSPARRRAQIYHDNCPGAFAQICYEARLVALLGTWQLPPGRLACMSAGQGVVICVVPKQCETCSKAAQAAPHGT